MTAISSAHVGKADSKHPDRWFAITNRLCTEGTDFLLGAAEAISVSNFVAQSYASWNGRREDGRVKTEADPLDLMAGMAAGARGPYVRPAPSTRPGTALMMFACP